MHVENKRLIMLFGILFSVVFCLMYYVLFSLRWEKRMMISERCI